MKKNINLDIVLILTLSFFGGLADGFSSIYRDDTFCFIQTGNLVRTIIAYVQGNVYSATYSLIIFMAFTIFCFVYWFILSWIKKTKIEPKIFSLLIVLILLIPSVIFKFNKNNYLEADNLMSGIFLSFIGSIIAIAFSKININKNNSIVFNSAIMTGNARAMMVSFATFVKTKNKIKGYESLIYLSIILIFVFGIATSAIINVYTPDKTWSFYYDLIVIYLVVFISITLLIIRYCKNKKIKVENNQERISLQ